MIFLITTCFEFVTDCYVLNLLEKTSLDKKYNNLFAAYNSNVVASHGNTFL